MILVRFRIYKYALTVDIKKMWRDNTNHPVQYLQLSTVTYGTRPVSFLATRTLPQLIADEEAFYPLASSTLRINLNVDDIVSG